MSLLTKAVYDAISDFKAHGFDSSDRLKKWQSVILSAAESDGFGEGDNFARSLKSAYSSLVVKNGLLKGHKIAEWQLAQLRPKLEAELNRRLMASADLIKLNREAMVQKTMQRFSGWASSIPAGGNRAIKARDESADIVKSLKQLPFTERRVMIDQQAKFKASLNNIVASETGAIAAIWKSHFRAPGYNYRPDHKERDGKIFVLRGNWAMQKGLMKLNGRKYTDEQTQPSQEVFCQCAFIYIYNLRDLPDEMLTEKGRAFIVRT